MENRGILDSKNEVDLYCLHAIFRPLLEESVAKFYRTWNIHKCRGLKSGSPKMVFEEGIKRLKAYAQHHGDYFTELDQVGENTILFVHK